MPTRIMIGQLPLIIEEDENMRPFASSSGLSAGQASPKDGEAPPTDMISNASDGDIPDEELQHKLGSENQDNNPTDGPSRNGRKRKRYHRHTVHQIHAMEEFFKACPHPDDKQRKQLALDLGLQPLQVKFWFQNKRTQMKTQLERTDNAHLKAENETLRAENIKFREALTNASCFTCGGPQVVVNASLDERQLRVENTRLREEIARMTGLAPIATTPYANNNFASSSVIPSSSVHPEMVALGGRQADISEEIVVREDYFRSLTGPAGIDKPAAIELVILAMKELISMAEIEYPLWISTMDSRSYLLNEDAYYNMFPRAIGLKPAGFNVEASKGTDVVMMNHRNLADVFMDMDKWLAMFGCIISRALVLEVISAGPEPGNFDGTLQMMSAEYQVLTPTVPTRENIFLRYCRLLGEGTWGIVDVSFDNLLSSGPLAKCKRKPSGCIIQEMPNGCSKITWVEHVQVQDEGVHYFGKPFVESGLAFGAQRWVSLLARQCERLSRAMETNSSPDDINDTVLINPEGRKNILKLSERMVLSFCGGVTSSNAYGWLNLSESGNDQMRIMTKKSENDPGNASGVMLSATTSFWLPISHKLVFEFLRDESSRAKWDTIFDSGDIQETVHITNSNNEVGNCVSLLRGENSTQGIVMMLQECSSHPTGSYIVYAPVDDFSMDLILDGGNPDHVAILPSGFTIYPSGPTPALIHGRATADDQDTRDVGSLVTVAFQIMVNSVPTNNISITSISMINNLIEGTSQKIREALTTSPPNP